jgi:hypothetical protein
MKYAVEMHSKILKDWFRHSEINRADSVIHRQHGDHETYSGKVC